MECLVALLFFGGLFACLYFFWRLRKLERSVQSELQTTRDALAALQVHLGLTDAGALPPVSDLPAPPPTLPDITVPELAGPATPALATSQAATQSPLPALAAQPATQPIALPPDPVPTSGLAPTEPETTRPVRDWAATLRGNPLTRWFVDSHLVVRIGILILFIGVAFLVKFAADQGWFSLEMRLISAGVLGVAMGAVGWAVRHSRRIYGLSLQGGGLGIAYITTFAAYGLYELLPSGLAFGLLAGLGLICGALAVLNNSQALAALAITGGFAAPVLAAGEGGSHVALFSYFALLNAAILGIAWFKAWRALNALGFVFTLVLASLWASDYYRPEYYSSVQPFLVLFFLFYVAIGLLFARRQPPRLVGLVDGLLVFGTPLITAIWQSRLVGDSTEALTWSAIALAIFYFALAAVLFRPGLENYATLRESYLAIGAIFTVLAVPLAFEAQITVAIWAAAGAGLFWVGLRQGRRFHAALGGLIQVLAGLWNLLLGLDGVFVQGPAGLGDAPFLLNSFAIGSVLIALGGLVTGYVALQNARRGRYLLIPRDLAVVEVGATLWGLLWWYGIGLYELVRIAPPDQTSTGALALFLVASGAVGVLLANRANWWTLRTTGLLLWIPIFVLAGLEPANGNPLLAGWGWLAWPGAIAVHYYLLWGLDAHAQIGKGGPALLRRIYHAGGLWLIAWLGSAELIARLGRWDLAADIWFALAWMVMPLALMALVIGSGTAIAWPIRAHYPLYLRWSLAPFALFLALWLLGVNLVNDGNAAPLPWLPVLNPLALAQIAILATLFWWTQRLHAHAQTSGTPRPGLALAGRAGVLALAVVVVSGELARLAHQWWGVPYAFTDLLRSAQLQATYSIVWAALAMVFMFWGARRVRRWLWLMGAALLALTILKLFVVDLSGAETIARIVSFIGVGLLMLIIGYFAPIPPRQVEAEPALLPPENDPDINQEMNPIVPPVTPTHAESE